MNFLIIFNIFTALQHRHQRPEATSTHRKHLEDSRGWTKRKSLSNPRTLQMHWSHRGKQGKLTDDAATD